MQKKDEISTVFINAQAVYLGVWIPPSELSKNVYFLKKNEKPAAIFGAKQ